MKKKVGGKLKKRGLLGMSLSPHTRVTSNKEKGQVWIGLINVNEQFDVCFQKNASNALYSFLLYLTDFFHPVQWRGFNISYVFIIRTDPTDTFSGHIFFFVALDGVHYTYFKKLLLRTAYMSCRAPKNNIGRSIMILF